MKPQRIHLSIRRLAQIFSLLGLAVAAAPASAESLSSVHLGPFNITLYDLAPTDGIAPHIYFNDPGFSSVMELTVSSFNPAYETLTLPKRGPIADGLSGSVATGTAYASATVLGALPDDKPGFSSVDTMGRVQATMDGTGSYGATTSLLFGGPGGFALSPHTLLLFSVDATVMASTATARDPFEQGYARAVAHLSMYGGAPVGNSGSQFGTADLSASAGYQSEAGQVIGESQRFSGLLGVTVANLTDSDMIGGFDVGTEVSGNSSIASPALAAPEPAGYALLLAGLALTLGLARRRRGA